MKKEYITPEVLIRRVILESMIADSLPIGGGLGPGAADARENSDWSDDEEYDNIWED